MHIFYSIASLKSKRARENEREWERERAKK